ncbi:hypothetical protein B0T24DRAFT_118235 [Lasiosphaeria ovina]|uniref:Zn(2)-C6 fungal-type domain-containing protein n=1 Tax=Lasiosphaeria ovina TaxID=92902 RepID=A0AAE0JSX2_9PEZI|nr:hypothetical protein B0T24DRAFT_118235 [Lasiosphaeria ovina]
MDRAGAGSGAAPAPAPAPVDIDPDSADMDVDMDTPTSSANSAGATTSGLIKLAEPRRRNRPALSCIQCRTRKIRCDRNEPCASCIKSKIVNCTYEEARRPKPRLWRLSPAPGSAPPDMSPGPPPATEDPYLRLNLTSGFTFREVHPSSSGAGLQYASSAASLASVSTGASVSTPARTSDPASLPGPVAAQFDSPARATPALADRVRQLEQQLADALDRHRSGPSSAPRPSRLSQPPLISSQGVLSKARYFGSSHWINGTKLFPLVMGVAEKMQSDKTSEVYSLLQNCKSIARSIKTQRVPVHISFDVGKAMPISEETSRRLVEAYFRTMEGVYRIVHVPSFWKEYQKYWDNPEAASKAFIVQLQLAMAIGTCFQDDVAALRHYATQWIYEAQIWLVSPSEKSRMTFAGLQTMCLLHLAKETCGVGSDLVWISAGSLLRTAMHMGLHRDPDVLSNLSTLHAELRRRLWATILEIVLQSSLDSGGPPLISLSDFDTHQPANYDDDQLAENGNLSTTPRPLSTFTQTTVQIALLRSFPIRLAIAQYANHFNSPVTYEETLKWNTELTTACRALSAALQPAYDPAGVLPNRLSLFQLRIAEQMVHRFFLTLNHPWLCLAQSNPAYYFARKMCVETSLKFYRAFATGSPAGDSGTASQTDDFTRLTTCGNGAFRSVPILAVLTICLELLWQAQEDRSFRQSLSMESRLDRLGPANEADVGASGGIGSGAAPRQDLFEAVKYSIGWTERRIKSGETSVKGYIMCSALLTQAQAVQRGASDVEVEKIVLSCVADDLRYCYNLLKETTGISTPAASMGEGLNTGLDDLSLEPWAEWDSEAPMECHGFKSIFNFDDVDFFG